MRMKSLSEKSTNLEKDLESVARTGRCVAGASAKEHVEAPPLGRG